MYFIFKFEPTFNTLKKFDQNAIATHLDMAKTIIETGDVTQALIWKEQVKKSLDVNGVTDVIKSIATQHNIERYNANNNNAFIKNYSICSKKTIEEILNYNSAYLIIDPCRVTLLKDMQDRLWLYFINMDMVIYGGNTLPPEIKKEALKIKSIIQDLKKRLVKKKR
jgi:uncharacterized protein (DUF302 family)